MKIAVIGPGAMGLLFGSYLSQHHDVTLVGHGQRHGGVLLHQEHAGAALGIDAGDDAENVFGELGAEAERRLVEQDQFGLRNQRAANGQHLLLAA